MSNFDIAHIFTERWEGGIVDHPNDPGGITNHGISLRFLEGIEDETAIGIDLNHDGVINGQDVKALDKRTAAMLMKEQFWVKLRCDSMPLSIATVVYDAAVNMGPSRSVKLLQQACNDIARQFMGDNVGLKVDGRMGPKTLQMVADIHTNNLDRQCANLTVHLRMDFYNSLVLGNAQFKPFLKGWLNRSKALLDYITEFEKQQ